MAAVDNSDMDRAHDGEAGIVDEDALLQHQKNGVIVSNRKEYARLDVGSMGVDLKKNFM